MIVATEMTTTGLCSGRSPDAARIANSQNQTMIPAQNARPRRKTRFGSSPACWTKLMILIEITGSTQGMMLRISPPMKPAIRIHHSDCVACRVAAGEPAFGAASVATAATGSAGSFSSDSVAASAGAFGVSATKLTTPAAISGAKHWPSSVQHWCWKSTRNLTGPAGNFLSTILNGTRI